MWKLKNTETKIRLCSHRETKGKTGPKDLFRMQHTTNGQKQKEVKQHRRVKGPTVCLQSFSRRRKTKWVEAILRAQDLPERIRNNNQKI